MFALILAIVIAAPASGRHLHDVRRCVDGSQYEVYGYNVGRSFHSILDSEGGVPSIDACARLCIADPRCGCAYYRSDKLCAWREDSCSSSELFINNKPVARSTGLVAVCPIKPAIKRFAKCGGSTGCCEPADHCMEQNPWYAQCLPRDAQVGVGWSGRVIACAVPGLLSSASHAA